MLATRCMAKLDGVIVMKRQDNCNSYNDAAQVRMLNEATKTINVKERFRHTP